MLREQIWPGLGRGQWGDTTALDGILGEEKVNGEGRGAAEAGSEGEGGTREKDHSWKHSGF